MTVLNGEGKTERWVKFSAIITLSVILPLIGIMTRQSIRLAVLETQVQQYSRDRMQLDEKIERTLEALANQHQQLLNFLIERQVEVAPMRTPAPTFPHGQVFDK